MKPKRIMVTETVKSVRKLKQPAIMHNTEFYAYAVHIHIV